MSAFFSVNNSNEDKCSFNGVTFYDSSLSKNESWGDFLERGNSFFCTTSIKPLSIKLWWKSVGKRKIDQFSYLNLYNNQDPNELIEKGIFKSSYGNIDLKKDFALIDEIAINNPCLLKMPNFCSDKNAFIAFSYREIKEVEEQLLLFDLSPFTEDKKTNTKKIKPRKINKISFLGIKYDKFISRLDNTDISFSDCIHFDSDIIVCSPEIKHSRGNYEPFVKNEDLIIPENALIYNSKDFDDVLKNHGF